uniref:Phosducin thioredoxin-like domain-containing protein n=2 Tax=Rhodnius prolixus TaxID=13249 RepID=T1I1G1_RHOPR
MSALEDKILGEKKHYYCSSSESEGEEDSDEGSSKCKNINTVDEPSVQSPDRSKWGGVSKNTGPKGVISDWQRYKQLETEKRQEEELERIELAKKLCLTCAPDSEQPKTDDNLSEFLSDDFLEDYRKKRMEEMLISRNLPTFGDVYSLANGNEFLDAIDNENKAVTIVIHIYETTIPACKVMNQCLSSLSKQYSNVKFCKIVGSSAGMSHRFKVDGVPALLVYKEGQIIGNFVRITDELGDEFYEGDVENFLVEHGILLDRFCVPEIIRQGRQHEENDDGGSDWS